MTTLRPATTAATRSGTSRTRWYPLQGGLLVLFLAVVSGAMYLGAAPGGAALRTAPPLPTANEVATVARSTPSGPARQHLVLLVSDPQLGQSIQRQLTADGLVIAEFGALDSRELTLEVVVAAAGERVPFLDGLREYEAGCAAEPCPAIRVLDLR